MCQIIPNSRVFSVGENCSPDMHSNMHSAPGWVAPARVVRVFHTIYVPGCWEGFCRLLNCYQRLEPINCSEPPTKPVFIPDNFGKTSILLKNYLCEEFGINIVIKIRIW